MENKPVNHELHDAIRSVRRFNRFYTSILGILNEMYLGAPVGLSEARVVYEIFQAPGCRAADLTKRLNMDRGYVSRIISRLEKLDFITRRAQPQGRQGAEPLCHPQRQGADGGTGRAGR